MSAPESLVSRVETCLSEWDSTDMVDTDLGVELADLGREVAAALTEVAGDDPTVRLVVDRLDEAVDWYDDLDEHDAGASVDVAEGLGIALRMLLSLSDE